MYLYSIHMSQIGQAAGAAMLARNFPRTFRKRRNRKGKTKLNKKVKSIIRSTLEKKYVDFYSGTGYTMADRTGVMSQITYNTPAGANINQGTGQSQRIGDSIQPIKLEFRMSIYYDWNAALNLNDQHTIRVIILKWNESTVLGLPVAASILQYPSTGLGVYHVVNSPLNYTALKQGDMTVIYDKRISVGNSSPTAIIAKSFKLQGKLQFEPAAATGAGHYYCYVVADDVGGAHTPAVYYNYVSRIHYLDG